MLSRAMNNERCKFVFASVATNVSWNSAIWFVTKASFNAYTCIYYALRRHQSAINYGNDGGVLWERQYTDDFEIEAVRQITEQGRRVAEVAERLGVAGFSLYA
jgi:hypothetical protein